MTTLVENASWLVQDDIIKRYLKVCSQAVEKQEAFETFKSNQDYTTILEHASKEIGWNCLKKIGEDNPTLLTEYPKFWNNDDIGSPTLYNYGLITCSPSTLQYILVLSNLKNLIGSLGSFKIIEIGGGYGGQSKIIQDVYGVKCYHIVDLYEPSKLQHKYLEFFGKKHIHFNPENYKDLIEDEYDLVISNYALSEIREPLQSQYIENILLRSKHGYITCNGRLNSLNKIVESKIKNLKTLSDIEGERDTNFILTW